MNYKIPLITLCYMMKSAGVFLSGTRQSTSSAGLLFIAGPAKLNYLDNREKLEVPRCLIEGGDQAGFVVGLRSPSFVT